MAPGEEQELRLEQYLRSHRSCVEIFAPDQQVRQELQLPRNCKCADILALHSPRDAVTEVTVAESKGTDISTALVQLGNAAAGALECFLGLHTLHLLICVPRLVQTSVGRSPGPGFTAGASSTAGLFVLQDAQTSSVAPARALIELGHPWNRWLPQVQRLEIELLVG